MENGDQDTEMEGLTSPVIRMKGDVQMGESILLANSNHGITTPTNDQLLLNASPINNHRKTHSI